MISIRHKEFRGAALWVVVASLIATHPSGLHSGDNMEVLVGSPFVTGIIDRSWDRRFYDGTEGWAGSVEWRYNDSNRPTALLPTSVEVTTAMQGGFDAWSSINTSLSLSPPLIPIWSQGADTTTMDAGAVDGINANVWINGAPGGVIASASCTSLTEPATTFVGGGGGTRLPTGPGPRSIPFPGPPFITYPAGTHIDCGVEYDSAEAWAIGASSGRIDLQSVTTHENGHQVAISHSTKGAEISGPTDNATMTPFVFGNNTDFRSLEDDDIASALRSYSRINGLPQTTGGRGVIMGTLKALPGCNAVTGVSVRAHSGCAEGGSAVETFSNSQFRTGPDGEFVINVNPGGPYTLAARAFESSGSGLFLKDRYNWTTITANLLFVSGESSVPSNGLAIVPSIAAGQTINVGEIGAYACVKPSAPTDTIPPHCAIVVSPGSPGPPPTPTTATVTLQDTDSGIACIRVLVSDNATVNIPAFTVGTTAPVVVVATKITEGVTAAIQLETTDVAGNVLLGE